MNLIPKVLVVGVFTTTGLPGTPDPVTKEKVTRIFADLSPRGGYTQLQMAADGSSAIFAGGSPDDAITIQPPIIQVRSSIRLTPKASAEWAEDALKTIAHGLSARQFAQLGVKLIYQASLDTRDGNAFVLGRLFGKSENDFDALRGGGTLFAGAKLIVRHEDVAYTVLIEPLLADPQYLYLDLDAQYPGPADLDNTEKRVDATERFLTETVKPYLDSL
jgi:hypothetical protein